MGVCHHSLCAFFDFHRLFSVTTREAESKETWGTVNIQTAQDFMRSPVSNWGQGAGELVKTTERVIKVRLMCRHRQPTLMPRFQYGLYDRPELRSWFKGRVVLLGDAAHPTSPVSSLDVSQGSMISCSSASWPRRKPSIRRCSEAYQPPGPAQCRANVANYLHS